MEHNYENGKEFSQCVMGLPDKVKEMFSETIYRYVMNDDRRSAHTLFSIIERLCDCESPIEKILLFALDVYSNDAGTNYYFEPQVELECNGKNYRVDILFEDLFSDGSGYSLAIECDVTSSTKKQRSRLRDEMFEI